MKVINGNILAEKIQQRNKNRIELHDLHPKLVIVQVGKNFASEVYVEKKKVWGEAIGVEVEVMSFDELSENKLEELIQDLNHDNEVNGIIVQLPLPKNIDSKGIFLSIWPEKDVDGLNPISLGALYQSQELGFVSATPLAVMEILRHIAVFEDGEYKSTELDEGFVDEELHTYLSGKNVLIVNRSNIVGKPLAALLLQYDATVTIAHSKTKDIKNLALNADIIVSGTGKSGFINKEMIGEKAILIDVGINDTANGIGGDIDYKGADDRVEWVTPVPGGVGPLTVAMLLSNTISAAEKQILISQSSSPLIY